MMSIEDISDESESSDFILAASMKKLRMPLDTFRDYARTHLMLNTRFFTRRDVFIHSEDDDIHWCVYGLAYIMFSVSVVGLTFGFLCSSS